MRCANTPLDEWAGKRLLAILGMFRAPGATRAIPAGGDGRDRSIPAAVPENLMSHFLDRLKFMSRVKSTYSDGHGAVVNEDRKWENSYRQRWQHDKIVRSTHGVNCTGSCSWKVYVKNGLITWETQQTDYPRTRPDLPNHEPRGCPRGASYSWYVYSAQRVKYPMLRGRLAEMWREARKTLDPVKAWASIVE